MNLQFLDQKPEPKFKIKNTEFDVTKLPAMDAWYLLEEIRQALAVQADSVTVPDLGSGKESSSESAVLFVKSVMTLPPAFVNRIREKLFGEVQFRNENIERGWLPLGGAEDMAFENLEPVHIYEVMGRCLIVNFHGSCSDVISRFQDVIRDLIRSAQ